MTIQIGRFGSDISLGNPSNITKAGKAVMVEGWAKGTNAATLAALLQQANGLTHPDESDVAVQYSYDTSYNGWYKVLSVQVELDPHWERVFRFQYKIELELLGRQVVIESILSGAERSTAPAALTPNYWVASPSSSAVQSIGTTIYGHTRVLRASAGTMYIYIATDFTDAYVTQEYPVASHYKGAATLKTGATLYTQIGRDIANTPTSFELSNGLVTVTQPSNTAYALGINFTTAAGGTPGVTSHMIEVGYMTAGPTWNSVNLGNPTGIACLRNSPEEVVVRISWEYGASFLDVSLRRGDRGVRLRWSAETLITSGTVAASQLWGFGWRTSAAFTAISGDNVGLIEDAADADGNKRVLIATDTGTLIGTATGRTWANASTTRNAWFGVDVGGADATDGNVFLQDFYMSVQSERQRIAAR